MTGATVPPATIVRDEPRAWWADPRLPLGIVPFALALGLVAEWSLAHAGVPLDGLVTDAASGLAFVAAGLIAWRQRPANRVGPLMTGIGLAWFGGDLLFTPIPLVGPLSLGAQAAARVLFAWLLLAFPSGLLGSTLHRAAVGTIGGLAAFLAVIQLLTYDMADLCACPPSPFAVAKGTELADRVGDVAAFVGIAMTAILVPLVVRRVVLASGPARRALIPVVAGGVFSLLSVSPELVSEVTGEPIEPITWLPIVWVALPVGFLIAFLDAQMARASVADLVIHLGETPRPDRLQAALATALRDPTVAVLRWSPEGHAWVDVDGTPSDLPDPASGRAVTLLESDAGPLAALVHDPALLDDPGLVASVGSAVRLAIENERLQAAVEAQLADVRASRARIVSAGDAERRRLERDLHDGAQQRLVALSLALRRAQGQADAAADDRLAESLDDASRLVKDALAELRDLARGIHPAALTATGLAGALPIVASGAAVPVTIAEVPSERLPSVVEATAYFFVCEALANVAKHAPAASAVVRVRHEADVLAIEVTDDGPGGAAPRPGSGLQGLDDRLAAVGGTLDIDSRAGRGTTLRATIPVPSGE